ncbi:VanW family protein [Nonomuraea sp. NPDC050556]|uniref:VanW family protein n=1 Tax=Nonomuraea sp. NPDC050556 TaxID=3364369 RepID=UPI0037A0CE21
MTRRRQLVLAIAVIVPVLAYGVPAVALAGEVPPGTSVAGVDIGGMSPGAAEARLKRDLAARAAKPLVAKAAGTTVRVAPGDLGLSLDAAGTVELASRQSLTPVGVVRSLFGRREIQPLVKVDEGRLAAGVADLAHALDRQPKEGAVEYRGVEPRAVLPKAGRTLDQGAAARALRQAFLTTTALTLPVRSVPPLVSAQEVRQVADGVARTAVAGPLTLTNEARQATLSAADLAARLRFVPDEAAGGLRPEFDAAKVALDLESKLVDQDRRPRDASFEIVGGRPKLVPSRAGEGIDPGALSQAVAAALAGGAERTIEAPMGQTTPRLTTEQAEKLGIKEKVGAFTTQHPCCAPRVTNIHTIADLVDGYLVKPGETFSLNGVVGKRDKARGFVEAPMILNNRFVNDVGGGVSQFATTMFNAVFFGGFQDVQHTPHQYYISRYPAGRESTVSYPQPDFRWRNDSPYGVLIKTSYTGTSITVQFWSTKRFDISSRSSERYDVRDFPTLSESGPDCIPMGGVEGFSIDVWRTFKKDGEVVREQKFHTVYAPEPRLTCDAPG